MRTLSRYRACIDRWYELVVAKSAPPDVLPLPFLASVVGKCNDGMLGLALTPDRWEALLRVGVKSRSPWALGIGLVLDSVKRAIGLYWPPKTTFKAIEVLAFTLFPASASAGQPRDDAIACKKNSTSPAASSESEYRILKYHKPDGESSIQTSYPS